MFETTNQYIILMYVPVAMGILCDEKQDEAHEPECSHVC